MYRLVVMVFDDHGKLKGTVPRKGNHSHDASHEFEESSFALEPDKLTAVLSSTTLYHIIDGSWYVVFE